MFWNKYRTKPVETETVILAPEMCIVSGDWGVRKSTKLSTDATICLELDHVSIHFATTGLHTLIRFFSWKSWASCRSLLLHIALLLRGVLLSTRFSLLAWYPKNFLRIWHKSLVEPISGYAKIDKTLHYYRAQVWASTSYSYLDRKIQRNCKGYSFQGVGWTWRNWGNV